MSYLREKTKTDDECLCLVTMSLFICLLRDETPTVPPGLEVMSYRFFYTREEGGFPEVQGKGSSDLPPRFPSGLDRDPSLGGGEVDESTFRQSPFYL